MALNKEKILKAVAENIGEGAQLLAEALARPEIGDDHQEWIKALYETKASIAIAEREGDADELDVLKELLADLEIGFNARLAEQELIQSKERRARIFQLMSRTAVKAVQVALVAA